jgi:rhamnose utilization protein RhaD (predicted bifunctional aldolase and dehydrogenase)
VKSLFDPHDAAQFPGDLALRAYTSRLLGGDSALVMHGGGNTSVKAREDGEDILYIKGSGADLAQVSEADFAPVRLAEVRRLIGLEALDNARLVDAFRGALKNPAAPRPSIETLLHAVLPFKWVEHTHADAVLAVADTLHGAEHVRAAFGDAVLVVPYRHSGFELAKCCHDIFTHQATVNTIGMVLMHHGIFAFGNTARQSYENMIGLVSHAQDYLESRQAWDIPLRFPAGGAPAPSSGRHPAYLALAALRRDLSRAAGFPLILSVFSDLFSLAFARRPDLPMLALRGPATPQHAVYTKRLPLLGRDVAAYAEDYRRYLAGNAPPDAPRLPDPAPRVVLDPEWGVCAAGANAYFAHAAGEIAQHAMRIMSRAEALDEYISLPPREVLAAEIEYGGFEEKIRHSYPLAGQVVLVADALARQEEVATLLAQGAAVVGLDRGSAIKSLHNHRAFLGLNCDPDDQAATEAALELGVRAFGGIDRLVGGDAALQEMCRPLLALSPLQSGQDG